MAQRKIKYPSDRELAWNVRMQAIYPLGRIDAMWSIMESLWDTATYEEKKDLEKIQDHLNKYDEKLRKRLRKAGWE